MFIPKRYWVFLQTFPTPCTCEINSLAVSKIPPILFITSRRLVGWAPTRFHLGMGALVHFVDERRVLLAGRVPYTHSSRGS